MSDLPPNSPLYLSLFGDAEVAGLLSSAAEIATMIEVERAIARAQGAAGVIPAEAVAAIDRGLAGMAPDPAGLAAGTAAAGVPVPALVAELRKGLERPAADYLHFGATSQDIVDTALMLRIAQVLDLLDGRLAVLVATLAGLARAHRATPMAGRTRGQVATPISFGLRAANWALPLARSRARLRLLRREGLLVQLGGASGDLAAMGAGAGKARAMADAVAAELGLCGALPWMADRQPLRRVAGELGELALALGKVGEDVILLTRSEVGELRLGEAGGSSTMPQKQNPVRAEAMVALARFAGGLAGQLDAAGLHREERDGAAWMGEWLVLPQMMVAAAAATAHGAALCGGLQVMAEAMLARLAGDGGLSLAEQASFALLPHVGRAAAQDLVKRAAAQTRETGTPLALALQGLTDAPLDFAALADPAAATAAAAAMTDEMLTEIAGLLT
jgi:3-carboxy-cis,cis-muconate cycloisomerase